MLERFFCAAESRANGEMLFGTVARIRSWLLLEYPAAWRKNAIADSRLLSDPVKQHLNRDFDRALLIRQGHTVRSGPAQCFHVDSSSGRMQRSLVGDYADLLLETNPGETVPGLLYAVCTHGRHDKCCAKFGLPVFCAVRDAVGERAWQCSHVGGDRFAANIVVFPYGLYYGHVQPEEVPELVRRSEAGEVWLERYRGRSSYSRPMQIGEYFVRSETGRMRIDELRPLGVERRDGFTEVRFAGENSTVHVVEFAQKQPVRRELLTCGSTELCDVPQYELVRHEVRPAQD